MHTEHASQDSELNTTMRDAMWRGHGGWEMALTPALFGFFGWQIDGWLGTNPWITVIGSLVGLGGSVANQYYRYNDRMNLASEQRSAARNAASTPSDKRFSKNEMAA